MRPDLEDYAATQTEGMWQRGALKSHLPVAVRSAIRKRFDDRIGLEEELSASASQKDVDAALVELGYQHQVNDYCRDLAEYVASLGLTTKGKSPRGSRTRKPPEKEAAEKGHEPWAGLPQTPENALLIRKAQEAAALLFPPRVPKRRRADFESNFSRRFQVLHLALRSRPPIDGCVPSGRRPWKELLPLWSSLHPEERLTAKGLQMLFERACENEIVWGAYVEHCQREWLARVLTLFGNLAFREYNNSDLPMGLVAEEYRKNRQLVREELAPVDVEWRAYGLWQRIGDPFAKCYSRIGCCPDVIRGIACSQLRGTRPSGGSGHP